MDYILEGYEVNQPTWFYLSLLLILAVYFRFSRFWSLRNFDLLLMLSIAPALLYLKKSPTYGALSLVIVTMVLLWRTLWDGYFTRRPKLPQNMTPAGMAFLCVSAMAFLGTKALNEELTQDEVREVVRARQLVKGLDSGSEASETLPSVPQLAKGVDSKTEASKTASKDPKAPKEEGIEAGPGARLIYAAVAATPAGHPQAANSGEAVEYLARFMAILAHLAVISGLICFGYYHMGDLHLGLAMATLYSLLPCTTYEVGRVNHVLPSALIVWAFVSYRRVLVAGALLGLACGTLFFPIFLLPLWTAFYGRRGWMQFLLAVGGVTLAMIAGLWLLTGPMGVSPESDLGFIDWTKLRFNATEPTGFWSLFPAVYRIPAFVTFLTMVTGLAVWPRHKDLATLMASSAAIIIATQLWYPQQGSVYVLWYLPIYLMVVFRPPLHHSAAPDANQSTATVASSVEPRAASALGSGVHTGTAFL